MPVPDTTAIQEAVIEGRLPRRATNANLATYADGKDSAIWVGITSRTDCASPYPDCHTSILHLDTSNRALLELHAECWAVYPMTIIADTAYLTWSEDLDTKYPFAIVSAIKKVSPKLKKKVFMKLVLLNDTTLKATYLNRGIVASLNRTRDDKVFFPDSFVRRVLP